MQRARVSRDLASSPGPRHRPVARCAPRSVLFWIALLIGSASALGPAHAAEPTSPDAEAATTTTTTTTTSTTPAAATPPTTVVPAEQPIPVEASAARKAREASLVAVLAARRQVESELRTLREELRSEAADGRQSEIERRIQERAAELRNLSHSFSELATGVDPASLDEVAEPVPFELARELRDLLAPLINEVKRATSRPREIDRLRTEIADQEEQLTTIDRAIARLDAVAKITKEESLAKALASERKDWVVRRAGVETKLAVARQKLDQRVAESRSVREAVQEVFQIFFKSRGRNLLLALLATGGFVFVLRRLRVVIERLPRFVRHEQTFGVRVFNLVYSIASVVGAVVVFVLALYFFGDWVLLILALLLIFGLVWASKQALPRFWSQAVLFLDMGPVREGQRVFLNGLPWRIQSISFYCVLVNPALVGGFLRLPIADVGALRSRPDREDEPWFPTREGDVVLLDAERPAIVEFQSTELVRLRAPGGNRIVVPTAQFLSAPHEVLSNGYRVDLQFGIDYESQAEITTSIRETMQAEIERGWRASDWGASLVGVSVEFSRAGRSSLDYYVRVDLDGSQAFEYAAQRRHLARLCVEVCNANGWVIPFEQITLHVAPSEPERPESGDSR